MAPGAANRIVELTSFEACTPLELEQRKLVRLQELRAVIDALRCERESADPLLAWAVSQQHSGNP